MIKKTASAFSVTARVPPPERETSQVANKLLRMIKQHLPAQFPVPKRTEAPGITTFTFSPDRKFQTKHIVAAILEALPDAVETEVLGANHNLVTMSTPTPLGIAYTETLTVMANDRDPESKIFVIILGN